jgi:thiamine-phosphate diphosphorylase
MQALPRLFMMTGVDAANPAVFLQTLVTHLQHGIQLIHLRAKDLSSNDYRLLAKQALASAKKFNAKILLHADATTILDLDADGMHLSSRALMQHDKRPLTSARLVSAACHSLEQLRHAENIGVDFVTLSPVARTATHPDAIPLGWSAFAELCRSTTLPVFGLGGVSEQDLAMAMQCGAYGIAAIRALWERKY